MEASESVAKLSQELAVKEKELAAASIKADKVSTGVLNPLVIYIYYKSSKK